MKKMKSSKLVSDYLTKLNWKVIVFSIISILVCLGLMIVFNLDWIKDDVIKNIILSVLSSFIVSAFLLGLWELFAKKSFAEEILNLADISSNIRASGLEQVYINFKDIDWREAIRNCDELTVVVAYAKTWRNSNSDVLTELVKRKGTLTVYLPNFNDINILSDLARRFTTTTDDVKQLILESADFYFDIGATVHLFSGTFSNSYYIIDKVAIMSFYNHHHARGEVPALRTNSSGSLYKYIENEIVEISNNSNKYEGENKDA